MRLAVALVFIVYLISFIGQPVVALPQRGTSTLSIVAARDSPTSDNVVPSPAGLSNRLEKRGLLGLVVKGISWLVGLFRHIHIGHRHHAAAKTGTKVANGNGNNNQPSNKGNHGKHGNHKRRGLLDSQGEQVYPQVIKKRYLEIRKRKLDSRMVRLVGNREVNVV